MFNNKKTKGDIMQEERLGLGIFTVDRFLDESECLHYIDMGEQMSSLVMAQRGFQASVQVTKTAQDSYASALQIGRA